LTIKLIRAFVVLFAQDFETRKGYKPACNDVKGFFTAFRGHARIDHYEDLLGSKNLKDFFRGVSKRFKSDVQPQQKTGMTLEQIKQLETK
jgi:hypothetical protein